jgi:NADH-quinone oxidoreductase subunit L
VLPLHEGAHGPASIITLAAVSVLAGLIGLATAWAMYGRQPVRADDIGVARGPLHRLVLNKYYVDEIYNALFVRPLFALCAWCARVFDLGVIDGAVNGVGRAVVAWARGLRRVQTGFVMNYALTMLLGAVAMAAFLLTR